MLNLSTEYSLHSHFKKQSQIHNSLVSSVSTNLHSSSESANKQAKRAAPYMRVFLMFLLCSAFYKLCTTSTLTNLFP